MSKSARHIFMSPLSWRRKMAVGPQPKCVTRPVLARSAVWPPIGIQSNCERRRYDWRVHPSLGRWLSRRCLDRYLVEADLCFGAVDGAEQGRRKFARRSIVRDLAGLQRDRARAIFQRVFDLVQRYEDGEAVSAGSYRRGCPSRVVPILDRARQSAHPRLAIQRLASACAQLPRAAADRQKARSRV